MIFDLLKKIGLSNEMSSILRRFLAIGFFTGIAAMIASYMEIAPEYLVPFLAAVAAAVDKASRVYTK